MSETIKFEDTGFPDKPLVREAYEALDYNDRRYYWISSAQALCQHFNDMSKAGLAAAILASSDMHYDFDLSKEERQKFDAALISSSKEMFDAFRHLDEIPLPPPQNQDVARYMLVTIDKHIHRPLQDKENPEPDYLIQDRHLRLLERAFDFCKGMTGAPEYEEEIGALLIKAREQVEQHKDTVPAELKFETSGLPQDPVMRNAFNLLLEYGLRRCNHNMTSSWLIDDIKFAKFFYENGFSNKLPVAAAALLKYSYSHPEIGHPTMNVSGFNREDKKVIEETLKEFRAREPNMPHSLLRKCTGEYKNTAKNIIQAGEIYSLNNKVEYLLERSEADLKKDLKREFGTYQEGRTYHMASDEFTIYVDAYDRAFELIQKPQDVLGEDKQKVTALIEDILERGETVYKKALPTVQKAKALREKEQEDYPWDQSSGYN